MGLELHERDIPLEQRALPCLIESRIVLKCGPVKDREKVRTVILGLYKIAIDPFEQYGGAREG